MRTPFQRHSRTSREAAISMVRHEPTVREKVLASITSAGVEGLTDDELLRRLAPMKENTVRPRRVELARDGLIVGTGVRKTTSGRNAVVWSAVEREENVG